MRYASGFQPSQSILSAVPSVANLDPEITINSNLMTTVARYNARDATTGLWLPDKYGEILTIASTGTDPTVNNGSMLYGPRDDSVKFPAGKVYQASGPSFLDMGTEHIYCEGLFRSPDTLGLQRIFSKNQGSITKGYQLSITSTSGILTFQCSGASSYLSLNLSQTIVANSIYYYSCYWDGSAAVIENGMGLYANALGPDSGTGNPSSIGTLTSASNFTIAARAFDFGNKCPYTLFYLLIAKGSNIYAGGAQNPIDWEAFHKHRFHSIFGIASSKLYSLGTYTRASSAFAPKRLASGSVEYNQVGSGMPAPSNMPDAFIGQLAEGKAINICLRCTDLSNWSQVSCTSPSSIASPIRNLLAYAFAETTDGAPTAHTMASPGFTDVAGSKKWGFASWLMAPEGRDFIQLRIYDAAAFLGAIYYQFSTDTFSTPNNVSMYHSSSSFTYSGKAFRWVHFAFLTTGGSGTKYLRFYPAESAGTITYTGDGRVGGYIAQAQIELCSTTKDCYLWLKLDDGSGSTLVDSSGNSRDQSLVGSATNFWVDGRYGANAGAFDATVPNYISLPVGYFNQAQGSWGCWVKADWSGMVDGNSSRIFCSGISGLNSNYEFRTFLTAATDSFAWVPGNGSTFTYCTLGDFSGFSNIWVHIGFTWLYDGSTQTNVRGYLNGVNIPTSNFNIAGLLTAPDTGLWIGRWDRVPGNFTGTIADFFLYWRALDADDMKLMYDDSPLKYRGGVTSPILTTTATATREAESLVYPYTNTAPWGSKICKFYKEGTPGCKTRIWELSDGADPNNSLYAFIDANGYFNADVLIDGQTQGYVQIAQNVCDKRSWILAARWTATVLDLVIYNMTTQITYTATTALTAFPAGLDENRPAMPVNAVIGDCDDLDYYEPDNRRLLFG